MAVTLDMLAVALGRTAPDSVEADQWQMWIDDALMLIEARLGDPALLDQAKLDYVVREAVVAHIRRPDDATQITLAIDDANSTRTYRSSRGRVFILDEWWNLLAPAQARGRAFEIDMTPSTATTGTYGVDYVWISTTQTGPVP